MKFVVIGEASGASMDAIMAVYPRHKAVVDAFVARGDVIGIVSAHCELAPDYLSTAVETLERTGADMVGGLMRAVGEGPVGEAVALATSTPFGVGGARFHYTDAEEEVDTVYMGLCRAEVYRRLRFDEEMVSDQDDELSYRLLDEGGRIVCNPAIRSTYRNRSTFRSMTGFKAFCSSMLRDRAPTPPLFMGHNTWMSRTELKPKRPGMRVCTSSMMRGTAVSGSLAGTK